jgi:hypothetical protein
MVRDERTAHGDGDLFPSPSPHLISRMNLLLDRPVILGLVAVLVSLLCCSALVQNSSFLEVKSHHRPTMVTSGAPRSSSRSDEVPVLFLALFGLAALALSQTRPSSEIASRSAKFAQAKKSSAGKSCPSLHG